MGIREATAADWPGIWPIWRAVVPAGTTYMWDPDTDEPTARELWMPPAPARTFVALDGGTVVGSALLKPNQPLLGAHVANAGFLVDPARSGRGIGRQLALRVIDEARRDGYRAMQFNAVVETNASAVALWQSLGFEILATVPEAFRHPEHSLVGVHIMHRRL